MDILKYLGVSVVFKNIDGRSRNCRRDSTLLCVTCSSLFKKHLILKIGYLAIHTITLNSEMPKL